MKLGNRASQHNFASIPDATIPRSKFNRSFQRKQTFDCDYLVPIYVDEVLPGDTFNLSLTTFARLATPIVPFMDNLYMDYFFFFVPNRLVWTNWQRFNGEQDDPGDSTDFTIPQFAPTGNTTILENTLQNYMGLPKCVFDVTYCPVSALPFRAYNLIYNEWFRDQNLQNSVVVDKDNGPDDPTDYVLLKRGKRHDYFTSALPWPQKGPSVEIPIGTTAPLVGNVPVWPAIITGDVSPSGTHWSSWTTSNPNRYLYQSGDGAGGINSHLVYQGAGTSTPAVLDSNVAATGGAEAGPARRGTIAGTAASVNGFGAELGGETGAYADLSSATAATINQLREAFQIQKLYERDARGGTRYIEIIRSHFGVVSPDARLQRPEYLGGGRAHVNINPVPQTSSTDAETPQGNLAAFGTQVGRGIGFQKSFVEHGYIIGLASARADLSYQQGINRLWNRQTRFDFYWPAFSHLGEQAINNSEIFVSGLTTDEEPFGYQERYAEYRYKPSEILGSFMSSVTASLDMWHLAQEFVSTPSLNGTFIQSDTPVDRVIAVNTEPHFLWDGWFNLICARPMPTYSVPGLIDHF